MREFHIVGNGWSGTIDCHFEVATEEVKTELVDVSTKAVQRRHGGVAPLGHNVVKVDCVKRSSNVRRMVAHILEHDCVEGSANGWQDLRGALAGAA